MCLAIIDSVYLGILLEAVRGHPRFEAACSECLLPGKPAVTVHTITAERHTGMSFVGVVPWMYGTLYHWAMMKLNQSGTALPLRLSDPKEEGTSFAVVPAG